MPTLVTGGAGFIGSTLVDRLLAEGRDVVAVDNFDPFYARARKQANLSRALRSPRFRLAEIDLRDGPAVHRLIAEVAPEAIVHLAAKAGVRPSIDDPSGYAEANVVATVHLMEAARRLPEIPRFVYASSSSVYGERTAAPFRESDPVDRPVSPYAATKKACELMAATFHHLHGLPATGLRLFTAYGPRNRPDLAIAKFSALIEAGEPIPMFGDGSTLRDYTFVGDIVDGIVRAVERCRGLHLYNLGNATPVPLRDMIAALGHALGKPVRLNHLPEQPGDVPKTHADISLARAELGYEPKTTLSEGLAAYVVWSRSGEG
ncbi:GDP-mannose 4,6-dehydratase [Tundrisphaera sp. TA3]|uniref:GDP-mannose 4,6-dehydratase n=1 Tax=Tundrisphaera sp. TA3 TaxID=3435775 RepID=UPI003EC02E18